MVRPVPSPVISIGELAARTGAAVSALRYYEERGLLAPHRSPGGQRRFLRSDIRRVSFIRIAQSLGLTIGEIASTLAALPAGRTPTAADWRQISSALRERLDARIAALETLRSLLESCIGCGCLSLKACALHNAGDHAGAKGPGPRFVMSAIDTGGA